MLSALLTLLACQKNAENNIPIDGPVDMDSVSSWIQKARDKSLDLKVRELSLQKAEDYSNLMSNDSVKLRNIYRIQWTYLDLADSLAFRRTNQITRDLASSLNDSTRLANAHWDLAHFFDYNTVSTKDSAYFHYAVAQEIFKALGNDLNAGKMLYNIASIQNQIKDYTGAEVNTIKAIEILKFLSANELLYDCYNVLAITSKDQKEYDRALDYYKTAESYLEKIDQKKTNLQTLENNIGNVYQELQNHPMAISYYEKVLEKDSVFYKDPQLYARALNNLAYNRMKAGQLEGVEHTISTGPPHP